jgi:hypothetical protein
MTITQPTPQGVGGVRYVSLKGKANRKHRRSKMKMKMLVFLVILALAPYLSAKISSQTNVDAMDGEIAAHIDVNEASGMVFTDEPNYYGTNAGFICDNNR